MQVRVESLSLFAVVGLKRKFMKILVCLGTRPEWLKVKPLLRLMQKAEYDVLFTGQHPDLLEDVTFDFRCSVENRLNRLDDIIISCMANFPKGSYDYVLVQGDTGSALGCALAAHHRKIEVIHLEAGLRTYDLDNPYPEESYRQMISRIAKINLCPTRLSFENLLHEKVSGEKFIVGNTVLDNLTDWKGRARYGGDVLITMHRRENHAILEEWFNALNAVSERFDDLNFTLPIHPNPNVQRFRPILSPRINVIEALDHAGFLEKLVGCRFAITDSGGIQEEAAFFNKKVLVCRKTTERPEGIATGHAIMCHAPHDLMLHVERVVEDYMIDAECPYGDGRASEKILEIIRKWSR